MEFLLDTGDLADGVKEYFGIHPSQECSRVILLVINIGRVRLRGELIDSRSCDGTNQLLEVKLLLNEMSGKRVEKSGIRRRVGRAYVVNGVNDAAPHELRPQSIRYIASEPWVVR